MKLCALCQKELLVCWDEDGEECCDDCMFGHLAPSGIKPTHIRIPVSLIDNDPGDETE